MRNIIVLLNGDLVPAHRRHPRHVPRLPGIRLRNRSRLRRRVNLHAGLPRRIIPSVRIAPVRAFVVVGELDPQPLVDPLRNKAGALACEVPPLVDYVAPPLVIIVVYPRAGDFAGTAPSSTGRGTLRRDETVAAGFDVVVGDVAAVGGFVPDVVAGDGGPGSLAGDLDVLTLPVGFDDGCRGGRRFAAIESGGFDGEGGGRDGAGGEGQEG